MWEVTVHLRALHACRLPQLASGAAEALPALPCSPEQLHLAGFAQQQRGRAEGVHECCQAVPAQASSSCQTSARPASINPLCASHFHSVKLAGRHIAANHLMPQHCRSSSIIKSALAT
jgi:hypothetical protein